MIQIGGLRKSNMEVTQEQVAYEYGIRYFHNRLYELYKLNLSGITDFVDQEEFLSIQNSGILKDILVLYSSLTPL